MPATPNTTDLLGRVFGRLKVASFISGSKPSRWKCICICGTHHSVSRGNLVSKQVLSCGCLWKESIEKHGQSKRPEYGTWLAMRQRCNNPNYKYYKNYGGRGIKVCKRWEKFENFIMDMGSRPTTKHTLERLDSSGDYHPRNCTWATMADQSRNKRTSVKITFHGITKCITDWADELGINRRTVSDRYNAGWPIRDVFSTNSWLSSHPRHKRK